MMLGSLVVLLVGLLWIRRLQFEPAGLDEGASAVAWDQPSLAARVESPSAADTERAIVPSIGEMAAGVFLGIWMFVLSGAAVVVTVIAIFGSLSGIGD